MDLKCIMLSERSQSQKLHRVRFHVYDVLEKAKLLGQRTDQWLPGAGLRKELTTKGCEGFFCLF